MSTALIDFATTFANGKPQPIKYMNKILSNWHNKNITTIEEAKNCENESNIDVKNVPITKKDYVERKYTKEEISSLFTSLEEIDI